MVVRKAMFRKEDTVRLAATNAVVDLILMDARSKRSCLNSFQESSSQASCSQQTDMPRKIGLALFHELSGLLKRCLSQQVYHLIFAFHIEAVSSLFFFLYFCLIY